MSIDTDALEQAIVPILQGLFPAFVPDPAVDIRVIRGEQSKPRPNELTYVNIRIADFEQVGRERVGLPDPANSDLTTVAGDYRIDVRIRGVGDRAKFAASICQFGFNNPIVIDDFQVALLAYVSNTELTHIPILTETAWEERSQFTVSFHYRQAADIDLGFIDNVESVDGTLDDCGDIINSSTGPIP